MKFSSATVIAVATLLQAVDANFDVYRVGIGGNGITGNSEGWQVYEAEANCDNKLDWLWRVSDDVSGGKYGLRCVGTPGGCGRDDSNADIEILEMNFNGEHFSKENRSYS